MKQSVPPALLGKFFDSDHISQFRVFSLVAQLHTITHMICICSCARAFQIINLRLRRNYKVQFVIEILNVGPQYNEVPVTYLF